MSEKEHSEGRVPCPECGRHFHRRGLASHRRQKHGRGGSHGNPGKSEGPWERVLASLARIEERLDRLEGRGESDPGEAEGREASSQALRLELEEVLATIRAVRAERMAIEGEWADERRRACDLELSRLRRRQARLLFELEELPLI